VQDLAACIVRVCAPSGETFGTGFVVSDRLVVTCAHVVKLCGAGPGCHVRVTFRQGNVEREAEVLLWHDASDVAILRVEGEMPEGVICAPLGRTSGTGGHDCLAFGYPSLGAVEGVEARGTIYRMVTTDDRQRLLQLASQEITPGFSGAPLLDQETERVVGMATLIARPDEYGRLGETAFATPAEDLHQLLLPLCPDLKLRHPQAVEDYMAAVRDYCANPPYLTLHDIRPPKTLDEVYVPLKAQPQPRKDKNQTSEVLETSEVYRRAEPLSIAEVMRSHEQPHVLILGEPGAGKSTLLHQLAERAWDTPEKIGLDKPHLPILVPLRLLVEAGDSLEDSLNYAFGRERLPLKQKLPAGFLTDWPDQTGARWLILLDALDEVPTDERARLMQWLKDILKTVEPNRIVITSRPSGYAAGGLDEKLFGHYDLLSFTPEQTSEFARKWFGEKADDFLQELERVRTGALRGTPLLLTIAAKVYLERGALPERRSALYDQFVDTWLNEAKLSEANRRDSKAELDETIWDVAKFALARLALAMTEQPMQSEASLSQIAAAYLRDAVPLSADRAQVVGERFVRVMARRSGVFTRRGDTYDFIHPTFREYLTASALVQEYGQNLSRSPEVLCTFTKWEQAGKLGRTPLQPGHMPCSTSP
jgi:GTPase SAR1 family protein